MRRVESESEFRNVTGTGRDSSPGVTGSSPDSGLCLLIPSATIMRLQETLKLSIDDFNSTNILNQYY